MNQSHKRVCLPAVSLPYRASNHGSWAPAYPQAPQLPGGHPRPSPQPKLPHASLSPPSLCPSPRPPTPPRRATTPCRGRDSRAPLRRRGRGRGRSSTSVVVGMRGEERFHRPDRASSSTQSLSLTRSSLEALGVASPQPRHGRARWDCSFMIRAASAARWDGRRRCRGHDRRSRSRWSWCRMGGGNCGRR